MLLGKSLRGLEACQQRQFAPQRRQPRAIGQRTHLQRRELDLVGHERVPPVHQFDEAAIDYCVTYEVSPPSWEPATCEVRISGTHTSTTSPPLSLVSEVSTSFIESRFTEDPNATVQVASLELSGQLIGDIGATLKKLEGELGSSSIVNVSCARLIRVDFIAAGDLLNWVLARRNENRTVVFLEAHRLVALFFGAMGINEHARVKVRSV